MFSFLKKFLKYEVKELEAKLHPTAECQFGGVGEMEITWLSDGSSKAELSLKHSSIPNSVTLEFYGAGELIGKSTVQNGYTKSYHNLTEAGSSVEVNAPAEIRYDGVTLYQACIHA